MTNQEFYQKPRQGLLKWDVEWRFLHVISIFVMCLLSMQAFSQGRTVSGKVVSSKDNAPLPGVNIVIKGTNQGTVTDANGQFTVSADDNAVLVISQIGMETQEITVGTRTNIDVSLAESTAVLEEVVVVGYGVQNKTNLTGAVATVDTKVLDSRPIADVGRGLQGTAPGLNIAIPSGELGTDPVIRIRGQFGSMQSSTQPLILLDNVEIPSLQLINPTDIESISILKDAASTSIYGSKGAFGVILITSKKGAKQEGISVNFESNFSFSNISRKMEMGRLDAMEYTMLAMERNGAVVSGAFYVVTRDGYENAVEWQKNYGGVVKNSDPVLYGRDWYVNPDNNSQKIGLRTYDPYEAMVREWAPTQIHKLSLSGMSGKTKYNIGLGFTDQQGINKPAKKDEFQRYNASVQLSTEVNKWMKVNFGTLYSSRTKSYPFVTVPSGADPWLYLYRWAATYPVGAQEDGVDIRSPYTEMKQANTGTLQNNFTSLNGGFTITPTKDWSIKFDYTYNNEQNTQDRPGTRFTAANSWAAPIPKFDADGNRIYVNSAGQEVASTDPGAMPAFKLGVTTYTAVGTGTPDYYYRLSEIAHRHTINFYTTYDLNLPDQHTARLMAGMNRVGYEWSNNWSQVWNLIDITNPQFNLATGTQNAGGDANWESQLGFFARLNYAFRDKYLFEANIRRDGSSKFPSDLRWRTFPSFSAGWLVEKESFMSWSNNFLDQFKVRASWGSIGDQSVPNSLYVPTMSGSLNNWIIGGARGYQFGTPGAVSQNVGWQNIQTLDIGADIRVLKNALGISVDWFQRDTKDMIVPQEGFPTTFGTTAPQTNVGSLRTKGFEIALDYSHHFNNGLRVNFTAMIADAVTKITEYGSATSIDQWYVGKTYGEIWGYETDRLYQASDFAYDGLGNLIPIVENGVTIYQLANDNAPTQEKLQVGAFRFMPGDVKYKDLNGDGKVDPGSRTIDDHGDLKVIGNVTPRYEYSFRAGADWKGVDFSIFIQGVGKREMWGDSFLALPGWHSADGAQPQAFAGDFWREDRTDAFYPRPYAQAGGGSYNNIWPQSRYLLNMAYARIKNITLGYSLSPALIQKAHLTKARVYVSLENFFTFSHLGTIPIDPENIPGVIPFSSNNSTGNGNVINGNNPSATSPIVGNGGFPRVGVNAPAFKSVAVGIQVSF